MSLMIRRKEKVLNEKIDVNARVNMNNSYVNRRPILLCYDALVLHQIFSVAAVAIYEKKCIVNVMSVVSVIRTKIEVVSSFVIYIYDLDTQDATLGVQRNRT